METSLDFAGGSHGYVERPGDVCAAHPFEVAGAELRCFWVEADQARLRVLCRRMFDDPTEGEVRVSPLGPRVALVFAHLASVGSADGATDETEAGFWVPALVEAPGIRQLAWVIPWLAVDNPRALVIGRESFGFAKSLGYVEMPRERDGLEYVVEGLARSEARPRLTHRRILSVTADRTGKDQLVASALSIGAGLLRQSPGDAAALFARSLLGAREVPVVHLRQLRDVARPHRAGFQEVVLAPQRIRRIRDVALAKGDFHLELEDLSDVPLARELGLEPRSRALGAIFARADFTVAAGRSIWRREPQKPAPKLAAPRSKTRVLVLGGGMGALSFVHALTSRPDAHRFEITVLETGFRLGGKCASGRNPDRAQRIEEHGLHVWFGCYDNAFRMLRDVWRSLPPRAGRSMTRWTDAFEKHGSIELWERGARGWEPWRLQFPENDLVPGDGSPLATPVALVRSLSRWVKTTIDMALLPPAERRGALPALSALLENSARAAVVLVARLVERVADRVVSKKSGAGRLVARLRARIGRAVSSLAEDAAWRRWWIQVDLALTALVGIAEDAVIDRGFEAIDDEDFRAWLARHGASEAARESAPIRVLYDLAFAYEAGDPAKPAFGAGALLEAVLRMLFGYAGAFQWKMRAGMGDVVFAPLYEVLAARGVRFEFFHRVDAIRLDEQKERVARVEVTRQATPKTGTYEPLVDVGGLPCFGDRPHFDQLVEGEELAARGVDLASALEPGAGKPRAFELGRDFDEVVLGIPVGALAPIAADLAAAKPEWQRMLDGLRTVATASAQLWMKPTARELRAPASRPTIVGGFEKPFDTWADLTHLLEREAWPADGGPRYLTYGCGPIPDHAAEDIRELLARLLEERGHELWPGAARGDRFDWDVLVDHAERIGSARLGAHVVRANVEPAERYVQSLPGSRRLRLRPDGSGFRNLWLTGDWTRSGLDVGCIEAAARSGAIVAEALPKAVEHAAQLEERS